MSSSQCLFRQDSTGVHDTHSADHTMYVKTCLPIHTVAPSTTDTPPEARRGTPTDYEKWTAAVQDPVSGRVYGIPGAELHIVVYDPNTHKVSYIGTLDLHETCMWLRAGGTRRQPRRIICSRKYALTWSTGFCRCSL